MQLGRNLRELWTLRLGFVLCLLCATLAAISACYRISLAPPGLQSRNLTMASASTRVLVDTPKSTVLNLQESVGDFTSMSNRAVLLGNVMASVPVRTFIAQRAHLPANEIKAATPLTPSFPRPIDEGDNKKATTDIFEGPDQYRINIQANPTVPVLDIYSEAPTAQAAVNLANGAVDGLRDYLNEVAKVQGVGRADQVRLTQLGRARGGVINGGVNIQVGILVFLFVFFDCAAAALFVGRVRRGWREMAAAEAAA
jgi:hypothetical protein